MKILVVTHESEFIGGANRALFAILKNWKENRLVEYEVLLPSENGDCVSELREMGVKYHIIHYYKVFSESRNQPQDILRSMNVFRKFIFNRNVARKEARKLRDEEFQLVYSNTRMTTMGVEVARYLGVPHVIHVREFGNENTIWGPANIKWIEKNSKKIITISHALERHLISSTEGKKFVVSYDGVSYFHDITITKKNKNTLDVLLTGRIAPAKAQDEAVRALAILKGKGYDKITLHLAGSMAGSSKYEKEYLVKLKRLIQENNLMEQVIFHGEVSDMKVLREKMDIELMCSLKETFGWVTVEGMRSGLLVIGGNTGATPEIIDHKKTGLLYCQGKPEELAEKIIWAIDHPDDVLQIRGCAYKSSYSKFTVERNAFEVYDVIQKAIEGDEQK